MFFSGSLKENPAKPNLLKGIVDKLQNYNALARLAVLFYTVCGSPPFLLLKFIDYNAVGWAC
ncbi:MAG: hypothetical protein IKZ88_08635 [Neisseriaceae bacterium]|nr:hypothetical protein [Neisseriaceae bacterium]